MAQSRRHSAVEVFTSTFIGFIGSWIITYFTFLHVKDAAVAATTGVVLCTVWSLVRGYTIRRHFSQREPVE